MYSEQPNSQLEDLVSRLIQKVEDLEARLPDRPEAAQVSNSETIMLQMLREMQKQNERNSQQQEKIFYARHTTNANAFKITATAKKPN